MLKKLSITLFHFDRHWLLALASALLASNLLINVLVVQGVLSPDGAILAGTKAKILAYNAASVAVGVLLLVLAAKLPTLRFPVKLHHAVLALLLAEALLRANLFWDLGIQSLRNPSLYSNGVCDDDFWVMGHYAVGTKNPALNEVEPLLGWTGLHGELRLYTDNYLTAESVTQRPILFFGDSFVKHGVEMEDKIPQMMDQLLPTFNVLNYGVGGYATDQITLRFKNEYPRFEDREPIVLIGILLEDMDRSLLTYRGLQKPYYEITNGELELRVPRYPTNQEFIDEYDLRLGSMMLSMLTRAARRLVRLDPCAKERLPLNRLIMKDTVDFVAKHGIDAHFVIFYAQNDLHASTARERELKQILAELGVTRIIDTKDFLLPLMERRDLSTLDLYLWGAVDTRLMGHHTVEANRAIAQGIVGYLEQNARFELEPATAGE